MPLDLDFALLEGPRAMKARRVSARRIRDLANLADEMLEGEDKHHWNETNGDGNPGDPKRRCPECRTIDLARQVADGLDPPKAPKGGSP